MSEFYRETIESFEARINLKAQEQREMGAAAEAPAAREALAEQREMDAAAEVPLSPEEAAERREMMETKDAHGEALARQFFEMAEDAMRSADVTYECFIHRYPDSKSEGLRHEMRENGVRAMLPSPTEAAQWKKEDLDKAFALVDELHEQTVNAHVMEAQASIDRAHAMLAESGIFL